MQPLEFRSVILQVQDLSETRWISRMAEAGLNTLLIHAVRLPHDINELVAFRSSDLGRSVFRQCHQHGIRIEYQMHTASWLVPRMLYWDHPDMFRMDLRGDRVSDCNFCLSSRAAWELFDQRAQKLVTELPSQTGRYLLFADDVGEGLCHCPDCAHLTPSDQAMVYANRMLASIRKVHPDARVSYLAYLSTLDCPETIRPEEGVFVEFAPIRRCYRHAIDDPDCAVNRRHVAALDKITSFYKNVALHITEYWLDAGRHNGWRRPVRELPVSLEVMQRDIAFYASRGAHSIATYGGGCDDEYWEQFGEPPLLEYGAALKG